MLILLLNMTALSCLLLTTYSQVEAKERLQWTENFFTFRLKMASLRSLKGQSALAIGLVTLLQIQRKEKCCSLVCTILINFNRIIFIVVMHTQNRYCFPSDLLHFKWIIMSMYIVSVWLNNDYYRVLSLYFSPFCPFY